MPFPRAMATWILRKRKGEKRFAYATSDGRGVTDRRTLDRIQRLRVPPAWTDVHIAASPSSAVQAWGFDAKGRKQYRYSERAQELGDRRKHYRVREMAKRLPEFRERLEADFRLGDLSRDHVAAGAVRLLDHGFFRVGSDRYAKENRTFGLTTLRKRHVTVSGDRVTFAYVGKLRVKQWKMICDPELARFVGALQGTPGARLFRYVDGGGRWHDLTADEVNDYLQRVTGRCYTAKDFRTWGGTLRCATVLAELGAPESPTARRKNVVLAVRLVAAELGNTPTICRKSYVHPIVIARYLDAGETIAPRLAGVRRRGAKAPAQRAGAHAPEERALIRFLDRHFPERRRRRRSEAA